MPSLAKWKMNFCFIISIFIACNVWLVDVQSSCLGLPDFSKAGYCQGSPLPGEGQIGQTPAWHITPQELALYYNVVANDGLDDTAGLQAAIDYVRDNFQGTYTSFALIELPSGTLNICKEIHLDANFLVIRGQGKDPDNPISTQIVFEPDNDTIYDGIPDFDLNYMKDAGGGQGGWIWPGRGAFRVQTRKVHQSYLNAYSNALANRKDFYEGTVNVHWKAGIQIAQSARQGERGIILKSVEGIKEGSYVWVGAANSNNMYAAQGVAEKYRINGHMRQQIFRVNSLSLEKKSIILSKVLEFDLPENNTSDGSVPIDGKIYYSKVVPLEIVEGVGLENFYITQKIPGLDSSQAVFNYSNLDHYRAMHGIVFKWAVNCYVKNVRTYMTGSHAFVTEMAKNVQVEDNYFEGSWNKGEGGNGYLRCSKAWDSLICNNVVRNLRHLALQWSSSGNVVAGNDVTCDINLHGGWERHNLIENNTVVVPYEHHEANGLSTWYPIWWAAGAHAGKWAGASGPQNIFFRNVLKKQLSQTCPYEDFVPYGSASTTVFQLGWDRETSAGSRWEHLAINGVDIITWSGNETVAYYHNPQQGINADNHYEGFSLWRE